MSEFKLPPGQQLAAADKWPPVGERAPLPHDGPWRINIDGCVERRVVLALDELRSLPQVERAVDVHCVTRWSKPAMNFGGVLLADVLKLAAPTSDADFVSFVAHSPRQHSTSLNLPEALSLGAMLVLDHDGRPLETSHGGPVRVVTPGRYFYKSLKWLRRIELLSEDRLGYWEAEAGYHNHADPLLEERYLASDLDPRRVRQLLASRDFSEQSLRSLAAADLDLTELVARQAILRNANFRGAKLAGACFDGANLSNAHFARADLRRATFRAADVEGADFSGADLRGADFSGASLFGATFVDDAAGAMLDESTRIDPAGWEQLTLRQATFLRQRSRHAPRDDPSRGA